MLGRLAEELHKDVRSIDRAALERCIAYDWPGNIRELNNVLTRAVLLARNSVITDELIAVSMGRADHSGALTETDIRPLSEIERDYVYKALLSTGWNIKRTAELLDISRVTLRKKITDYHLAKPPSLATS
jgi:two-component system response regulator AtoC